MRTFIKGTRRFSQGRRDLSRAMEVRQIRRNPENSSYEPEDTDVLLNWGQSGENYADIPTWINHPSAVAVATHKTNTFDRLRDSGVPTVEHTLSPGLASDWLESGRVLHRALQRGSQGRGISEITRGGPVPEGGFFVKVFGDAATKEYRIHVVDGEVIDRAEKRRRSRDNGYTGRFDQTVRSASNGWVFCRENLVVCESLDEAAINAIKALGLDFGAVDCALSSSGEVCVYEVNTAPGLEGTTLVRYTAALSAAVHSRSA